MTTLAHIAPFHVFDRIVDVVESAIKSIRRSVRRDATRRELMAMDDRMLTDIGLTRGDVILMGHIVPRMADVDPLAGYGRL